MRTIFSSTMCLIGVPFIAQTQATEAVLVELLAPLKVRLFFTLPPCSKRSTIYIAPASPYTTKPFPCCTNVIVHLPTGTETIAFISQTNSIYDLTPHEIAEIS